MMRLTDLRQGMGKDGDLQRMLRNIFGLGVAHQAPAVDVAHPVQHGKKLSAHRSLLEPIDIFEGFGGKSIGHAGDVVEDLLDQRVRRTGMSRQIGGEGPERAMV